MVLIQKKFTQRVMIHENFSSINFLHHLSRRIFRIDFVSLLCACTSYLAIYMSPKKILGGLALKVNFYQKQEMDRFFVIFALKFPRFPCESFSILLFFIIHTRRWGLRGDLPGSPRASNTRASIFQGSQTRLFGHFSPFSENSLGLDSPQKFLPAHLYPSSPPKLLTHT